MIELTKYENNYVIKDESIEFIPDESFDKLNKLSVKLVKNIIYGIRIK